MAAILLLALVSGAGCMYSHGQFDPWLRGSSFQDAQRHFTQLVRWGQFDKASGYVAEPVRGEFLRHATGLEDVRFTDYEVLSIDVEDGLGGATVEVEYRGYRLASMIEKTVAVTQRWEHEAASDEWRVRPQIRELEAAFADTGP